MAEKTKKSIKPAKENKKPVANNKTKKTAVANVEKKVTKNQFPVMGGFFERFVALFLDSLIVGFLSYLLSLFISLPLFGIGALSAISGDSSAFTFMNIPFVGISMLFGVLTTTLYFGYFYTKNGQSLGKKVMNLKVVKSTDLNQPITWGDTFIREVLGKYLSRFFFLLGYLWYFMSDKRQAWHDSIAKTYVVKVDDKGNTLMGQKEFYEKKPLATFGCCGCMGIILVMSILGAIATAGIIANQLMQNRDVIEQEVEKFMDVPTDNPDALETPEDFQRYFEEQLQQELQDYQEQQL